MGLRRYIATFAAVALLGVAVTGCSSRSEADARLRTAPLAAVLSSEKNSSVTIVDLERGEVVARHRLRSPAFDIAADAATGTFVTAQAGGVGADSDRRVGVIRVRDGQGPSYVELPWPNPERLASHGGKAYVVHGVVDAGRLRLSAVDLATGSVVATGHAPDGTSDVTSAGGHVLVPHFALGSDGESTGDDAAHLLGELDPTSLAMSVVVDEAPLAGGTVATWPGDDGAIALGGPRSPDDPVGSVELCRVELDSHAVTQRNALRGLRYGMGGLASTAGAIAVLDADPLGGSATPGGVVLMDPGTLSMTRRLPVSAGVTAIAGWDRAVLIAESGKGVLRAVDTATGESLWSVPIEGAPVALSIAVLGS